ncbi:MAG: hypothetical protein V4492_02125, partial [Chlamydiota bacterium]
VNRLHDQLLKGQMDFHGQDKSYVEFQERPGGYFSLFDVTDELLFRCQITTPGRGAPASIRFYKATPETTLDQLKVLAGHKGGPLGTIDALIQRTFKELPQADQDKIRERLNAIASTNKIDKEIGLTDRVEQHLLRGNYEASEYFLSWALKDYAQN